MKRIRKPQGGIQVYKSATGNTDKTRIQKILLTVVHVLAVWFVMAAWWETVVSVFPSPVKSVTLYTVFLLFAVVSVIICRMKREWLWILFYLAGVAYLLWLSRALIPNVLNYITDSYIIRQVPDMQMPERGIEELYNSICMAPVPVYHVELMSEWRLVYVLGLFTAPLFLILAAVLYCRRGKWASLVLMLIPCIFILVAGYVPSLLSVWLLILSGSFYCAACDCNLGKRACIRSVSAAVCMGVIAIAVTALSVPIEKQKTVEDGIYQKTYKFIKKDIITEIQDRVKGNDKKEEAQTEPPKESQAEDKEEKNEEKSEEKNEESKNSGDAPVTDDDDRNFSGIAEYKGQNIFSEETQSYSDGMNHLNDLSRYKPNYGYRMTVKLERKPDKTVYYPLFYGVCYDNGAWDKFMADGSKSYIWTGRILEDKVLYEGYYRYEGNLDRLEELCEPYFEKPLAEISDFIQREFEENTVYDYEPGRTPDGKDFAEYFLFENKKGFCVHFATTAALMYRICGYPSRYAQGYAIPAEKFAKQKDGTYAAAVTGDMGHAWCEVYDEKHGWLLKEHTLAYTGEINEERRPASDSDKERQYELRDYRRHAMPWAFAALLVLIMVGSFILRVMLIRKNRKKSFKSVKDGILNVYKNIYEIEVFFEKKKDNPLSHKGYENIKKICPKKWHEELKWLYWLSMETMFHDKISDREERKKAAEFYSCFSMEMRQMTKGWQRFRYCYLKCF